MHCIRIGGNHIRDHYESRVIVGAGANTGIDTNSNTLIHTCRDIDNTMTSANTTTTTASHTWGDWDNWGNRGNWADWANRKIGVTGATGDTFSVVWGAPGGSLECS